MYALTREETAHIVNISSLFGIIAPAGQAAYCAAKFGLRGFSEALRHELEGTNLSLTVVHPGGIRTEIANSARIPQGIDPEEARAQTQEFNKLLRTDPADAAEQIARAIESRAKRLLIGNDAKMAERLQRLFPVNYWKYIKRQAGPGPEPKPATSAARS
jgi:short-subunit dehydrogenase